MVEYETALEADISWMAKAITHNRCADFFFGKSTQRGRVAYALEWGARRMRMPGVNPEEIRERVRSVLVDATRAYATLVSRYYGKPWTWEPFIVETILATPEKYATVLNMYEYSVKNRR